jgi:hypothetical protein
MAVDPNLHVSCKTVPTTVDAGTIALEAVQTTIGVYEQYLSPEMLNVFRDQLEKGGEVSVRTRDIGRAQKKRDFRKSELHDVNRELGDMLEMLIRRFTMDKEELLSNMHHIVRKGIHPGSRTIHATVALRSSVANKLRKVSGQHGITFQHCFRGDPEALKVDHERVEVVWMGGRSAATKVAMRETFSRCAAMPGFDGLIAGDQGSLGVRVAAEHAQAARKTLLGSATARPGKKWLITGGAENAGHEGAATADTHGESGMGRGHCGRDPLRFRGGRIPGGGPERG